MRLFVLLILPICAPLAYCQPIEMSPNPLGFGFISVGGSHERTITIRNISSSEVVLDSCQFRQPFYLDSIQGTAVPPGDSLEVSCRFVPQQVFDYSRFIWFFYNGQIDEVYSLRVFAHGISAFGPGEIIWSYQHIDNVVCAIAADDYDGDAFPEVVAEGYYNGAEGSPLVCLSGSGYLAPDTIWSAGADNDGGYGDKCLASIGDLNGNEHRDIVRGTAWQDQTVYAVEGLTGATIWSYRTAQYPPAAWIYAVAGTGDLNRDGIGEVLAGAGSNANRAYCLSGDDGVRLWSSLADDAVAAVISVGDVNGDRQHDAVLASIDYGHFVTCVSGASQDTASKLWKYNMTAGTYSLSSITDLNNDTYRDVIAGTWGRGVVALSGHSQDTLGTLLWEHPIGGDVIRVISCPDLNGDGHEDVLVALWSPLVIALSGIDGSELWSFPCGDDAWAIDFVHDVTGDSIPDVAAGSFDNHAYLLDGVTGSMLSQCAVGAPVLTIRGTADINGDGFADIIAGTQKLNGIGGQVFMISGKPFGSVVRDSDPVNPRRFTTSLNYPNPFNGSTTISFELSQAHGYTVSIFDVSGRLVDRLVGDGSAGTNKVAWWPAHNDLASGVYLYRIDAANEVSKGKMSYVK